MKQVSTQWTSLKDPEDVLFIEQWRSNAVCLCAPHTQLLVGCQRNTIHATVKDTWGKPHGSHALAVNVSLAETRWKLWDTFTLIPLWVDAVPSIHLLSLPRSHAPSSFPSVVVQNGRQSIHLPPVLSVSSLKPNKVCMTPPPYPLLTLLPCLHGNTQDLSQVRKEGDVSLDST